MGWLASPQLYSDAASTLKYFLLTITLRSETTCKMKDHKTAPRKRRRKNLPRKLELWELWSYRFVGFLGFLYEGIRAIIHR